MKASLDVIYKHSKSYLVYLVIKIKEMDCEYEKRGSISILESGKSIQPQKQTDPAKPGVTQLLLKINFTIQPNLNPDQPWTRTDGSKPMQCNPYKT